LGIGSAIEVERRPDDRFGCDAQAEHANNQVTGMAVGAIAGGVAGCAIGQAGSDKSQTIITPQQRDFTFLKSIARYPQEEPESLKRIGR